MTVETAGIAVSTEEPIQTWLSQAIQAELLVTSGSAITGAGEHTLMSEELGTKLAAIPGVQDVLGVRMRHLEYNQTRILVCSLPLDVYARHVQNRITGGDPDALLLVREPTRRAVVVSENFLLQQHAQIGDQITLLPGQPPFEILASTLDYSWNRGTVLMHRAEYQRIFGDSQVDSYDLYLQAGTDPEEVRRRLLEQLGAEHQLVALTHAEFRQHIKKMMDQFYTLIYANAVMAMFVSFLGVANTLLISVLQRRRELGLLRAVGATRGQVAWSVLAQAVLIALLGLLLGIGLGSLLQEYVLRVLMVDETGFYFAFLFPMTTTLVTTAMVIMGAQLAGAMPALRAAWQPISEAVAYE
jgi:putative ABC transport system permease protein